MELKVESEKVLEAAEQCPDVKRVLKTMFPKAFEEGDKYFDLLRLHNGSHQLFSTEEARNAGFRDNNFFQVRGSGNFRGRAFYLNTIDQKWEIFQDSAGETCLLPTRK